MANTLHFYTESGFKYFAGNNIFPSKILLVVHCLKVLSRETFQLFFV
jgi:hypothetical protein